MLTPSSPATKASTIGAELIQDRQGHSPYRAMGPTVPDGV